MAIQAQRFLTSKARWIVFGLLVTMAGYLLAVAPVTTYLDQRQDLQAAEKRQEVLVDANQRLSQRVEQLKTDAEIQRLARERYELVPPGAQAYAVMPAPGAVSEDPEVEQNKGLWDKIWSSLPLTD